MRQPLQLQIAEPCHENWQQMTPQQQGRFCGSCQKTVVDFTNMTDNALLEYFKNFKGETCGRFTDDQLQWPLIPPPPKKPGWHKWAIASFLSCLIFSNKAKAQAELSFKSECRKEPARYSKGEVFAFTAKVKPIPIEIKGTVLDENGMGVPYASIQVKDEKWGVSADSLGNYVLKLAVGTDSLSLVYSAAGFEKTERSLTIVEAINQKQDATLAFKASLSDVVVAGYGNIMRRFTMGAVTRVTRIKKIQTNDAVPVIKDQFCGDLYPNPVKAGADVYLPFKLAGNFGLRLVTTNGQRIFSQPALPIKSVQAQRMTLPANIAAGIYFVEVLDAAGKTISTKKLLVVL